MKSTLKVSSSALAKTIKTYDETGSEDQHRKDPELPLLKRISSLELPASEWMLHSDQVIDTSQHQLFRCESALHGWIATKKPLIKDTNKIFILGQETWAMDIRQVEICPLVWVQIWDFGSNRCVFVRRRVGKRMIAACVVSPLWRVGVLCWLYWFIHNSRHSIREWYAIPSDLCLVGQSICFSTGQWPKTHL